MGKCHFQQAWLQKKDNKGHIISSWAHKISDYNLFCKVCDTSVNISKGFYAIKQHYETSKHADNTKIKLGPLQLLLTSTPRLAETYLPNSVVGTSEKSNTPIRLYNVRDSASTAELIWAMKLVGSNYSTESTQGIFDVFRAMFTASEAIPPCFSLSPTKVSYLLTDALGPYFREKYLKDLRQSYYTLQYDETTNNKGMKELQVSVSYWSEEVSQICNKHLETFFIGHATGEDLSRNILKSISNADLSLNKLLVLGSDGPNVNQKVFRLINEEVKAVREKGILNIGFCNIHVAHNSFLNGLRAFGEDSSDLVLAIYYFFHGWPTRIEDFGNIQMELKIPQHVFLKHVSSRWLTLEPAALRVIEQWDALLNYFFHFIPHKKPKTIDMNSYKKIVKLLKQPLMKAQLLFVASSAHLFTRFTCFLQREEPLIHILHSEIMSLVTKILGRVCKKEAIEAFLKNSTEDPFEESKRLPLKQIECGQVVKGELLQKVSEIEKMTFLANVQKHYVAAGKHFIKKSLINSTLLNNLRCLQPTERTKKRSCSDIVKLGTALPLELKLDVLLDEWKLLQLEKLDEGSVGDTNKLIQRIDHYWQNIFVMRNVFGEPKYPTISAVVKACLTISHGSAEVERRFSVSANILSEDRARMSDRMLNARLTVKDGLKQFNNKPELVPITKELITLAQVAYKSYHEYLEKKSKQKQVEETTKKLEEEARVKELQLQKNIKDDKEVIKKLEEELVTVRRDESFNGNTSKMMLQEANNRLKEAIKKKDFAEVKLVHAMIEGVKSVRDEEQCHNKKLENIHKKIEKRQSSLINTFISKKPKRS